MTHITLSKKSTSHPSLEFYSDGSGEVRRITIEKSPFRIGRAESADLRVESAEVSREHAEFVHRNGLWLIRDLGSTNGTLVNGKPIQEALLADGDILTLAETELTFFASAASQFQRMVTQPIPSRKSQLVPAALPDEIVATRMLAEATLHQTIPIQLFAAMSLRHGLTEAYFAPVSLHAKLQPIFHQPHAVADRFREVQRLRALERAVEQADAGRLFLAVAPAEIEISHRFFAELKQLRGLLSTDWELGVTISLPTDVDILRIGEIYREAREHDLLVAYDEFQGNGGQVMHLKSLLPDFLVLDPAMTKDLASNRQPLRRLESLLAACDELAIKPVLPPADSSHTTAMCQEIGFDLVLIDTAHCATEPRVPQLSTSS